MALIQRFPASTIQTWPFCKQPNNALKICTSSPVHTLDSLPLNTLSGGFQLFKRVQLSMKTPKERASKFPCTIKYE
eukprot:gene16500-705_t